MTQGVGGTNAPVRVFLVGYYGVGNLGDEQIRIAVEEAAVSLGVQVTRWATRRRHEQDPRAVRLGWGGAIRYVASCWSVDRVVLGGGGILKDEGLRLPIELLLTALAARLAGRPVALLAVGVGPFYTRVGRWMIRATARLAAVRTVRDRASAQALASLGIAGVEVGADPIFSYRVPEPAEASAGTATRGEVPPTVLVSVRPWFHKDPPDGEGRWDRFAVDLATVLDEVVASGRRVRFVGLYWPRDQVAAEQVRAAMKRAEGAMVDREPVTWRSLTAAVREAEIVVAMRYHAVAASVMASRPTIPISYEPKVSALAEVCRLAAVMPGEEGSGERLAALVHAARDDPAAALPAPGTVDELRRRSKRALQRALVGRV